MGGGFNPLADARGSLVFDAGTLIAVVIIVFKLDLVIKLAGIGGVEDGDGAAAFFGGVFGGVHGVDKLAEGFETGVGEFIGVWRHWDPLGRVRSSECREQRKKTVLYPGAVIAICARKPNLFEAVIWRKSLSGLG